MLPRHHRWLILVPLVLAVPSLDAAPENSLGGRPLAAWVEDLSSKDAVVREKTLDALAQLGPAARDTLAAVQALQRDPSPVVRRKAALALWKIDGRTEGLAPLLGAALKESGPAEKRALLQTLGELGVAGAEAAPALADLIADDAQLRYPARMALVRMGEPGARAVGGLLDRNDRALRVEALAALADFGPSGRALAPAVRKFLKDTDAAIRLRAAWSLYRFDPTTADEVAEIVREITKEPDAKVRREAVQVALLFHPPHKALAPVFLETLEAPEVVNRLSAARSLAELDPKHAKETLPVLTDILKTKSVPSLDLVVQALIPLGAESRPALPTLLEELRKPLARFSEPPLIELFTALGPEAATTLTPLLDEPEQRLRNSALRALGMMGEKAVPPLTEVLDNKSARARLGAAKALGEMGPAAREAVPKLRAALADKDPEVQLQAVITLGRLGRTAGPAALELAEVLADAKRIDGHRLMAARSLGLIGPEARKAVPALNATLEDANQVLRAEAALALYFVEPGHKKPAATLSAILANPEAKPLDRYMAAFALSQMGTDAVRTALPGLGAAVQTPQGAHRVLCVQAIRRLGTGGKEEAKTLKPLLKDMDPLLAQEAAITLVQIGQADADALALLTNLVKQPTSVFRLEVRDCVLQLGPRAKDVLPALEARWRDPSASPLERVRVAALMIALDESRKAAVRDGLREIRRGSDRYDAAEAALVAGRADPKEDVVPELIESLGDASPFIRQAAADSLGQLGAAARRAAPNLEQALKDTDPQVRLQAARALWRVSGEARAPVAVVVEVLQKSALAHSARRSPAGLATVILGEMGPAAREAVPALRAATEQGDATLRTAAVAALEKIDPRALAGP